MINLFIDTNILLNFFSYSSDHLNKLEELVSLVKAGKIRLFIPQQVVDEFNRNRDGKLKDVLRNLNSFSTELKSPVICHDLEEMKKINQLLSQVSEWRKKLVNSITSQIKSRSLKADALVNEIFRIGKPIAISEAILSRAKVRFDIGNPPGKDSSYGDAINWETLIDAVPDKEDLYFIGRDKDYVSEIDENDFSSFLRDEWKAKKKAKVFYYDLLSKFLKEKFAETKITDEQVKEEKNVAEQEAPGPLQSIALSPEVREKLREMARRHVSTSYGPYFQKGYEEIARQTDFFRDHPEIFKQAEEVARQTDFFRKHPEIFKQAEELQKRMPEISKQLEELNKKLGRK